MKKILYLGILLLLVTACKENYNIYSDQLKAERELIESYIKRKGIKVVTEEPEIWADNVYWKHPDYDNFYFRLEQLGDTMQPEIEALDPVLLRFKRYTLEEYADTLSNWTTLDNPEPVRLEYMVSGETSCTGWQVALTHMKYTNSHCKIICPSKLGFDEEKNSVTPYAYDLKIIIKRY